MTTPNPLNDLQQWYLAQCNGDWEHQFGIVIETLDNPGWSLKIDLTDTSIEQKSFTEIATERDEHDWIFCKVESKQFKGSCGPKNFIEMLTLFLDWSR
jgi:Immunity protein 53